MFNSTFLRCDKNKFPHYTFKTHVFNQISWTAFSHSVLWNKAISYMQITHSHVSRHVRLMFAPRLPRFAFSKPIVIFYSACAYICSLIVILTADYLYVCYSSRSSRDWRPKNFNTWRSFNVRCFAKYCVRLEECRLLYF